jgi:hypothetical protein
MHYLRESRVARPSTETPPGTRNSCCLRGQEFPRGPETRSRSPSHLRTRTTSADTPRWRQRHLQGGQHQRCTPAARLHADSNKSPNTASTWGHTRTHARKHARTHTPHQPSDHATRTHTHTHTSTNNAGTTNHPSVPRCSIRLLQGTQRARRGEQHLRHQQQRRPETLTLQPVRGTAGHGCVPKAAHTRTAASDVAAAPATAPAAPNHVLLGLMPCTCQHAASARHGTAITPPLQASCLTGHIGHAHCDGHSLPKRSAALSAFHTHTVQYTCTTSRRLPLTGRAGTRSDSRRTSTASPPGN